MAKNTYKEYRVRWKHEVYFKAKDDAEAKRLRKGIALSLSAGEIDPDEFEISFECIDDDYRDIP